MVENISDVENSPSEFNREDIQDGKDVATTDVNDAAMKTERAKDVYYKGYTEVAEGYTGVAEKPGKQEIWIWIFYELCSYFIHSTLLPVLFPLIISQITDFPQEPDRGWGKSLKGLSCPAIETKLYEALTQASIPLGDSNLSPLEWTSSSWAIGLILAASIIGSISTYLDYGRHQILIAGAAVATGSFFCLPIGFFKVTWIFPPYIAAIVAANIIATAPHTRHLGLMVQRFTGPNLHKHQFPFRTAVASWLSLYATAAGSLGSAILSAFTYHMLRHQNRFLSLWVVSIFSGLKWAAGICHVALIKHDERITPPTSSISHFLSIFRHPHASGSLILAFLSSFTTMCVFTASVLYLIGHLCFKPTFILYLWLIYFIFPVFSLPMMQPLQYLIKANAVKMHLLGFFLVTATTAVGFYFKDRIWQKQVVLIFAALQGTSAGLLHAFGRVLLIDCAPTGKEGAFSAWLAWCRSLGTCAGFAVASAIPGNVSTSFGITFIAAMSGIVFLIFGNVSDYGGAMAAGHVRDVTQEGFQVSNLDSGVPSKEMVKEETA